MAGDAPDRADTEPVAALMERAGVPRARIARHDPLAGGSYNTLHRVDLTDGTRLVLKVPPSPRIALYRCYLYLIMLVEVTPRGYQGEHLAWVRDFTGPRLEAALDTTR